MLNEQSVSINFSQGLNTKTDPWQLPAGQFLSLQNSVFQKGGLLTKRNGYGYLGGTPPDDVTYLTTLSNNLLGVGNTINAYSEVTKSWISKGTLQPCSLNVVPLIRNNLNQTQTDSAKTNGLICVVYTQVNSVTSTYLYAIEDAETGQNIVAPTAIPTLATGVINGSSRIFVIENNFVIVSPVLVSAVTYLQYVSIPTTNPSAISDAQNTFAEAYVPISGNPGWDGAVGDGVLLLAYNTTAGGQGIHVTSLTLSQIVSNSASGLVHSFTNAAYIGAIVSVCVDTTVSPNNFYISFWNNGTTNGYTAAVYSGFGSITNKFTPQLSITTTSVTNLSSASQNNSCSLFFEVDNNYSYDSTIPTHYIKGVAISSAGSVGTSYVSVRSVGLASKAFIVNGIIYYLAAFQSPFQPSYFLMNGSTSRSSSPIIVAKLAYQNGGGYLTLGLPRVSVDDFTASIAYLYKQSVEALNTLNDPQQTTAGGIYSQLGINQVDITLGTDDISSSETANDLHLSGGYLSMFDGYYPVEHNFFLFPDSIKATWTQSSVVTPTGTFSSGSFTVVVSSATGVSAGMSITDTTNVGYIPSGTFITNVNGTTLTISKATTNAGAGDNLSIQGNVASKPDGSTTTNAYYYQATYEWTDMQGNAFRSQPSIPVAVTTTGSVTTGVITVNVPTLRLTQKIPDPVKIVIYRWSVHTNVYNQVTSITSPVLNSTTTDSISFVDTLPDASVVGNNLIYTTGGVVPDTNGPATNILTLFDTRLWLLSAEDPNTFYVSKTVIQNTPVEMSSVFTVYISPNIGTTASTGPVTAAFPMDDKLIIFKKNSIFYINGTGPDNLGTTSPGCPLGNYSPPIFVTSVVGCTNQQSIALTQDGLMFSSDKGVWLLSRSLQTTYIGAPVEQYNSSIVTSSVVVPEKNYVLFSLDSGEMLMYDYYFNQWGTFQGVPTESSCIYNGVHTVLTQFGDILHETPGIYLDGNNAVLLSFTTSWFNLATIQGYERFYEFYILGKYFSPHYLNIQIAYDYNPSILHNSIISPPNYSPSTPSSFGVPTPVGSLGNLEQWRIHAKRQLCQSFQITVSEIYNVTLGAPAGAGFSMSGMTLKVALKKSRRPIAGASSVG